MARTDPCTRRHAGITYFLVDMNSPGVSVRPLREMTGDALFNEVFLADVLVPDDLVVGEVGGGWRVARTTLANERVSLSRTWTLGCGTPELLDACAGSAAGPAGLARAGRGLVAEGRALDILGMRVTLKQLPAPSRGRPAACASCSACATPKNVEPCVEAGSGARAWMRGRTAARPAG